MFNIFPDTNIIDNNNNNIKKVFTEYAWDFENDDFILQNGRPIKLEGKEALKVWIYKALKTQKNRYLCYSNFGQEYENLLGINYTPEIINAEVERYTKEALAHEDILNVSDFNTAFTGSQLSIYFKVDTVYGNLEMEEKIYV